MDSSIDYLKESSPEKGAAQVQMLIEGIKALLGIFEEGSPIRGTVDKVLQKIEARELSPKFMASFLAMTEDFGVATTALIDAADDVSVAIHQAMAESNPLRASAILEDIYERHADEIKDWLDARATLIGIGKQFEVKKYDY